MYSAGTLRVTVALPALSGGGVATALPSVAVGLMDQGADVNIVVLRGTDEELARHSFLPLERLGTSRSRYSVPSLISYLGRQRPDVLLSGPNTFNVPAIVAGRLSQAGARIVVSEHGNLSSDTYREHYKSAKMKVLPHLMRLTYPHAHGLVAPSRAPLEDPLFVHHMTTLDLPTAIIPNPLRWDIDTVSSSDVVHPWLERKQPREIPVLVAVGRLAEQKGYDVLIRAIAQMRDEGLLVRLILIGEGPKRCELEKLSSTLSVSHLIDMPGYLSDAPSYIREADLFVLASNWESFGNVLIEAMYCRTPIVATAAPTGPIDILDHGKTALLVPVGDAQALASAVKRVLTEPETARALAQAAFLEVDKYKIRTVGKQYLEFFHEVMLHRPSTAV